MLNLNLPTDNINKAKSIIEGVTVSHACGGGGEGGGDLRGWGGI